MTCLDISGLVEQKIDRILTQYRESYNLLSIIRHDLNEIANIMVTANGVKAGLADVVSDGYNVLSDGSQIVVGDPLCPPSGGMFDRFDILSATGDQLTIIGKVLGFPRCHCVCFSLPAFGFDCHSGGNRDIGGFCDVLSWSGCNEGGFGEVCIDDDETYRRLLLVRRYQARQLWSIDSLQSSIEQLWGNTAAVINMGGGRVGIAPGRDLSPSERMVLPIAMRVIPVAPGIEVYLSMPPGRVFGFGGGWGGMCEGSQWFCPELYTEDCD